MGQCIKCGVWLQDDDTSGYCWRFECRSVERDKLFASIERLRSERDEAYTQVADLHAMCIDLAHALRLQVTSDRQVERVEALEKWQTYVRQYVKKWGAPMSPLGDDRQPK